mmetsp:Transcript_30636/g.57238  ORF Transcript_30636/g.57238 Transcript_30636/m.57238 type:complete len:189 (-) Transcript_30636:275-841(-)|eukprot:CAMPEP_0170178244 /NCGR_PEP_ID=MMETSP0040_2-20121228/11761_1 /TAXON_ID=641309 /ORGANISM="Lotharella oceanica, Strain CCMP622" /LENGTH=188 /DNA_ID=CAMNT_0010421253 /DNA_START=71 /DNA_END=637 /DNA_ORIENTATION=-
MEPASSKPGPKAKAELAFGRRVVSTSAAKPPPQRKAEAKKTEGGAAAPPTFAHEEFKGDPIPYRLQGNKKMYTKKALAKRKQLSQDAEVKKIIQKIWQAVPKENELMTKQKYFNFFMRVCKMLNPDMEFEDAIQTVDADWEKDSKGKDFLDESTFHDCMFEIVDHWTLDISTEEYIEFLESFLSKMTT